MKHTMFVRMLALMLACVICFGLVQPAAVLATENQEQAENPQIVAEEAGVADYASFVSNLKVLEGYAEAYAPTANKTANELVINFIRTGVERYNDGNWKTLAGEEITAFTTYVEQQDAANGTTAMLLRNIIIDEFYLPNGNQTDFGHMFGTLNIAYVASQQTADLGGWAGDVCDLLFYSKYEGNVPAGTVDEMAEFILTNCFGVNADDAFGMDDFYGDMDAYYLNNQAKAGMKLSTAMESYFTAQLTDSDRAAYFLNDRFDGLETREDVRKAIYDTYAGNVGLQVLEADRGLSGENDLRKAACYAFADYLFNLAGDRLEGGSGDEGEDEEEEMDNEYYSVFSSTSSILAPGIEQTIRYATTADKKQIVYYVATVDVTRDDVTIMANYRNNDPSKGWGMQRVQDQANALLKKHTDPSDPENYIENFNVIVATNADGYNMSTGKPGGLLVMEGVEWHPVDKDGFFAILKDGTAMIGTQEEYETYKDQIQEGVGGFGAVLIHEGQVVAEKSSNYYNNRASRTAIGITADGKVVMMVLDGRQEPFSAGGSMEEIAQIMLDAGCVEAVNLDGGGSSTYLSKGEGSDTLQLVNRPSDGYARSVATSLAAISTAKSSREFDHANITSEYDYLTIGTSVQITASGVSNTGNAAPVPESAVWQVSDETVGSISEDGIFTALDNGQVQVQLMLDGNVVGEKTLNVVIPDAMGFEKESMNLIFGVPTRLPLVAYYQGNPVAFSESDVELMLDNEKAGTFDGLYFTPDEENGIRNVMAVAFLLLDPSYETYALINLSMYKDGESVFDFDNVTAGNRQLAWDRNVSNSTTEDNVVYRIDDISKTMDISYVFALDMESIEIPPQLADLTFMLPGADQGSTAWDFLLYLAERVSVLTEVKITVRIDQNLDVDISDMTVKNEYFKLKSAELDENNVLTLTCNWIDQTQAIDPLTANPICILSGVKATPKEGAAWNEDAQLDLINNGEVSYRVYLRASSLYSFAKQPENQQKFGLVPYSSQEVLYNGGPEQGAYFGTTYAEFEDAFTLDKSVTQGWVEKDQKYYYYVDNQVVTGDQYLPSREDPSLKLFYHFDENGVCTGLITGLIHYGEDLYYAVQGEMATGWRAMYDAEGNAVDYFFDRKTGKAVDGQQKIDGYNYTFTDHVLTRGDLVKDEKGTRYRWAGEWIYGRWFQVDGNWYHAAKYKTYVTTGWAHVVGMDLNYHWHLFDENGVFQINYSGKYDVGEDTYLLKNGVMIQEPGLVLLDDGYYYYFCSTGKAIKNRTYWPTITNGLLPAGPYKFDELGRITNPPTANPEQPDPDQPESEPKNGIVEVGGKLYYYKNDAIQYAAGLVKLQDADGNDFYIYVRSNGQLAIGRYWITNHNDLMNEGMYEFGEDGKMILPDTPDTPDQPQEPTEPTEPEPEEPETPKRNGVVNVNGTLYYYINDKIAYCAGVVQLADGSYIYVRSNGILAVGKYWITNTNDLMPQGMHKFSDDGIMLDPPASGTVPQPPQPDEPQPEPKNGIVDVNGTLYYYENDKIAYAAGLIKMTDDNGVDFYIYVRSNGQLATGKYWPTNHNDLLPYQAYNFGTDGRLYL